MKTTIIESHKKICKVTWCNNEVEDTIKAWGKIIIPVNCKHHRTLSRTRKATEYQQFTNYLQSQSCNHNNRNAGGYCSTCHKGYDFS